MGLDLFEWKKLNAETIRDDLKEQIREGSDLMSHFLFTEEQIQEIKDEIAIEDFCEVLDIDEADLDIQLSESSEPQDSYEFIPEADGDKYDIEVEFDLNERNLSFQLLGQMRDSMFAEDYEIEMDEANNKAKVSFKRAGGKVTKKKSCGKGMKLRGNKCIPQSGGQKSKERMKGIKLKRAKKAMGGGKKKKAALKAKITKKRVAGRSRNYSGT